MEKDSIRRLDPLSERVNAEHGPEQELSGLMPGYCWQILEVIGPEEEIRRFKKGLIWAEDCYLLMASFIPCPDELMNTDPIGAYSMVGDIFCHILRRKELRKSYWAKVIGAKNSEEILGLLENVDPDAYIHGLREANNIGRYGSRNWYDFQMANWGARYGDTLTELTAESPTDLEFEFFSFRYPILPGIDKLAEQFPRLLFHLVFMDLSNSFDGYAVWQYGQRMDVHWNDWELDEVVEEVVG